MCITIIIIGAEASEVHTTGKSEGRTRLHSLSRSDSFRVESISEDPKSPDFMAFRIVQTNLKKNKERELSRFRAENIVHMRNFMASLGGSGPGLFSSDDGGEVPVELSHGKWDEDVGDECDAAATHMTTAKVVFASPADGNIQSYSDAIGQFPVDFYFNHRTGITLSSDIVKEPSFPGSMLPLYDAIVPVPEMLRRPIHDSFRPPLGHPTKYLKSMGYGMEVGLQSGMQQVHDPCARRSFILDHGKLKVITEDIRAKLEPVPKVEPSVVTFGDYVDENMPSHVCKQEPIVTEAYRRARSKPIGCTLIARGRDGSPGKSGSRGDFGGSGRDGKSGSTGFYGLGAERSGENGGDGRDGGDGTSGERGKNANRGGDVILLLNGSADELLVAGSKEFQCQLGGPKAEQVLLVDCHGGKGGDGGKGGNGGSGGDGGNGGNGVRGNNAWSGNGGNGGAGGDGGNAGNGGRGGDGGDGGNAGDGGNCVIQATDPTLLMLVEVDCMSGEPGNGGNPGTGGNPGRPGSGGKGGEGGKAGAGSSSTRTSGNVEITTTAVTHDGAPGRDGDTGTPGRSKGPGKDGDKGKTAQNGGFLWVVWSDTFVYESNTRYDAFVEKLSVLPALDDGIFEPNERITVSNILVRNTGGLTLPHGATAFIPPSKTIKFEPSRYEIPDNVLKPSQRYVIPSSFHGRINDLPPPNQPGHKNLTAEFCTRIELLGRPFEKSYLKQKLTVQYPVQLGSLSCRENMGRGEISAIKIEVENISRVAYGSCKGSGGKVVLHMHFDSRLLPVGVADVGQTDIPYEVTYDPSIQDSMYIELLEIPPKDKICVTLMIQMESRAELFHRCHWQADLYLRGKLIEYNHQVIRVTPTYDAQKPPADALLVTSTVITRKEFVFWQHILELLDISVDFWDTTRYHGLSVDSRTEKPHDNSWRGRYAGKMILYPHCNLKLLQGEDIAEHFHGKDYRASNLQELGSSFVAFMPKSTSGHKGESTMKHLSMANPSIEQPGHPYGGRHLFRPSSDADPPAYVKWEKQFVKKLEKTTPSQSPLLLERQVDIKAVGCCRYSYGCIDIRQVPILKSSKFLEIDGMGGNMVNMSLDDAKLSPTSTDIPLASKYGQVFLATLYGLPISAKLNLMKKPDLQSSDVSFCLPNKSTISRSELAMINLAWEVADELFSGSGQALRMQEFYKDVKDNTGIYQESGCIILRGLRLIKQEAKKRKKRLNNLKVRQGYRAIADMSKQIRRILIALGVDGSKLDNMLSLDYLQDPSRVHRCHQHFLKEDRWNLLEI